ncbi:MAG TPA: exodeoxyribonuclease VII small subunit [Ignavibacteriaceae bacterium]|jgi:exodeoxyribonuclease VII small subunit|nr:MAG: Exodeoxyribonuclease 7 small subunit [Ignavibacteria bacterium ADurb.Bin266]OQY72880.1 MAG: exodeoxyribonuclease VII small subunit [Ignavibacteriales bacterium UTCHB2]HQF42025.1 exodeoxyribonuclease VII small subunit [Ignavibacteriaceae bacterium]HQI42159.1 exodeoxyribonuclease VII small subunit [Ignavibacteriaceae bacterium]HQJ46135.1 exodeoxyribonuclease VII small subunit [Ignavibacteriaceae bacterium]
MSKKKSLISFEDKLKRLEAITEKLESGEVDLEQSIVLFEEGVKLSKECISILNKAELKITTLQKELNNISINDED